jgi:hypothetical protein
MKVHTVLLAIVALLLVAWPATANDEPLEIAFLTEEFSFSENYQSAVADVIREQFSDQLKLVHSEQAELCLYITGTDVEDESEVQRVDISIRAYVSYPVGDSRQKRLLVGPLVLSELGGLFAAPSDQRVEDVKLVAQRVLTEFLRDWKKAEEPEAKTASTRART